MRRRIIATPGFDKTDSRRWVLWIGQCAPTLFLASGFLGDALEDSAQSAVDHKWYGLVEPHDKGLPDCCDGCDNCGDGPDPFSANCFTYTESGWIGADEWGIMAENPTREQLISIAQGV